MPARGGDMELDQNLAFHRREWLVQRIGWWILSAFVVAAALGLFGDGVLSRARAGAPGAPVWVEYERFVRVGAPSRMYVHVGTGTADTAAREVRISREYLDAIRVEHVSPEPERVRIGRDDVSFFFRGEELRDGGTVIFDIEPLDVGSRSVRIAAGAQPGLTFTQFAYF